MPSPDPVPLVPSAPGVVTPFPGPIPVVEPGRVALSLTQNVVLEIQCGEKVEIKKVAQGLEIVFQDGKAFHIPFKDVA